MKFCILEVPVFRTVPALILFAVASLVLAGCANGTNVGPTSPSSASFSGTVTTFVEVPVAMTNTAGTVGTWNWAGQSVTTPSGDSLGKIRFNWYTYKGAPTAFGRLYILKQEYLGTPNDVGPSMPGVVARSESIVDNQYVFAADVTLSANTKYWFYTDTQGSFVTSFDTDPYPGGEFYVSGYPTYPFHKAGASGRMVGPGVYVPPPAGVVVDANFTLQATTTQR
jgi:hypothetical protein